MIAQERTHLSISQLLPNSSRASFTAAIPELPFARRPRSPKRGTFFFLALWRRIIAHCPLDPFLVLVPVLLEQVVGLGLGGRLRVWVVQQVLHAQQDLLDGNGGLPPLLLVQDRETDRAGRVDVGVEERRDELAWGSRDFVSRGARVVLCWGGVVSLHFGGLVGYS